MIELSLIKPSDILIHTEGRNIVGIVLEIAEPFNPLTNKIYIKILHKSKGIRVGFLLSSDPYIVISCSQQ
jgi:hypothetical protein